MWFSLGLTISLPEAMNQAVKIVIAVKFDFNFAFLSMFFDHDFGAEMTGEILSKVGKMYLLGAIPDYLALLLSYFQAPNEGFGFSDRQFFGNNRPPGRKLLGGGFSTQ